MDLHHHLRVLRQSWPIVTLGVLLGLALAALTTFQVTWSSGPELQFRSQQVWQSTSTIFLTSQGFPEGRAVPPTSRDGQYQTAIDPQRTARLAFIYGEIAQGDQVKAMIGRLPQGGTIKAQALQAPTNTHDPLPMLQITTSAADPKGAFELNRRTVAALRKFVEAEQGRTSIPEAQRVHLSLLNKPSAAYLFKPRPVTGALAAFILSVLAALSLVYVLENLRTSRARAILGEELLQARVAREANGWDLDRSVKLSERDGSAERDESVELRGGAR